MKSKISPSMMCADIMNLKSILKTFEQEGIEFLHIDIMFEKPESKIDWFPLTEGDYVSVHVESTRHLQRVLAQIRAKDAKAMVAINPATPISSIEHVLDDIDGVLIMTVNPGFAGQKLVPATLKKITDLRHYLDEKGYEYIDIEVDGNVSFENAKKMKAAGANIFVAGTSSIFKEEYTLAEGIQKLRQAIEE